MILFSERSPRDARGEDRGRRSAKGRLLTAMLVLLGLFFVPASVFAHPVILIKFEIKFQFNARGLEGFWETWWFDTPHSAQIMQMFSLHPESNGEISPSQLPALKRGFFDDLRDYNYFSSVVVDGKEIPTKRVSSFSASYADRRVIYHFFVPLAVAATPEEQEVDVTVWDPTYYTDLSPEGDDAVTVEAPESISAKISVANDHRHFYNLAPDVVLIKPPPFYLKMQVVRFKLSG